MAQHHLVTINVPDVCLVFTKDLNGNLNWNIPHVWEKSPLPPWNGTITELQPDGNMLCHPSRGQYRRLPAVRWESALDLGPGWGQRQEGVDDPTPGLLRKGVWMVRRGLRLEGSGLLAAPWLPAPDKEAQSAGPRGPAVLGQWSSQISSWEPPGPPQWDYDYPQGPPQSHCTASFQTG